MAKIEARLNALGLVLPPAFAPPPGVVLPFVNVRLIGNRAVIAGHGPQSPEGPLAQPLGKIGRDLTLEQGYIAAKLTALSMLGYLKRALGDLDRISHWCAFSAWSTPRPALCSSPPSSTGSLTLSSSSGGRKPAPMPAARWGWPSYRSGCRWKSRARSRF